MSRYIDAEKLKNKINAYVVTTQDVAFIKQLIDETEPADVAPVVHAQWIEEEEPCEIVFITPDGKATTELYIEVKCSNCKRYTGYVYSHYLACQNEYCQHCGARMDGKEGKE